jgi:hypothetical protein
MWSAHRIPQLHFQLSKPDRYFFIQVTTQYGVVVKSLNPDNSDITGAIQKVKFWKMSQLILQ